MNASSYLFMSKKNNNILQRQMENQSITDSNMSIDSLEQEFNKKTSVKETASDENVQTILVPFYEKDVLIKVPKNQTKGNPPQKSKFIDRFRKDQQHSSSYLVNKDVQKAKRTTYLEIFRKQITKRPEIVKNDPEIRSMSPEVGDTERESFEEDQSNLPNEFYNTESYNEMYYEKLLNQQMENDMEHSSEEGTLYNDDLGNNSPNDNLRSVSEVSQPRHRRRRATVVPVENVKLGGLGPDIERIKPRLERARSLQRYSEQVRMANRLRIYKKSVQDDHQKKEERELQKQDSARKLPPQKQVEDNVSYLVNKTIEEKSSKQVRQIYDSKSKSATAQKREKIIRKEEQMKVKSAGGKGNQKVVEKQKSRDSRGNLERQEEKRSTDDAFNVRVKSSVRSRTIRTEIQPVWSEIPPVHISFLVNLGGVRPSSALRSLEEKHRHYQEQVKAYMDHND